MTTINLPMDVAREISKFNDHSKEIEQLKAELAEQKTKTDKYAEYLFTVLEGESQWEHYFCDVCGFQSINITYCDGENCGKDLDPTGDYQPSLCVCDGCKDECFADYQPICLDCYNGETKIPRIRRLTDAYERHQVKERKELLERRIEILKRIIPTCSKDQIAHFAAKKEAHWFKWGIYHCAPLRGGLRKNPKDY